MSEFNRICFACKSKLKPNRNKENQFIFIDNKFYHEECFKKVKKIGRVCFKCKREIDLCNKRSIKFQNHFYHYDCFAYLCTQQTAKWKNAKKFIDQYEQEAIDEIEELKTKLNYYEKIENQTLTDFHEVTGEKDENTLNRSESMI